MANAQTAVSSVRLVDAIPALKHLPSFIPGTGFKNTARVWSTINVMSTEIPYAFTKSQMDRGGHNPSFVSKVIEHMTKTAKDPTARPSQQEEEDLKWSAAMLYNGGLDTTIPILVGFYQAMAMFPEVQRKAQAEIDSIVGRDRLPSFSDRPLLAYINAVVQESIRWNPTAPSGFPHMVSKEFVYNGYTIPKGAIIFAGIWWICRDPETYNEPDVFEPARFLDPRNEPNPNSEVFGYGRRVCSGRRLADMSIFLTIAQTLAAFNISKAADERGQDINVKLTANTGFINRPVDFPYRLEPRDAKYVDVIRQVQVEHPRGKSHAQFLHNDAQWQSMKKGLL
jgi:hypothetical protein